MTTWSQNISRFSSLLVALGLMLGLTVTGCSDHDRNGSQSANMTEINYIFAVMTSAKTTLGATTVILTAFDANGSACPVEQLQETIANHTNITEEGVVGVSYYEGHAHVNNAATKLVLTYLDDEGNQVGSADVLDNISIEDGFVFNFTDEAPQPTPTPEPTGDFTWDPAETAPTIKIGESKTITAKDGDVNLTITLSIDAGETRVIVNGAKISGAIATAEGETVEVVATATDATGKIVDTKTFNFTVVNPTSKVVWFPATAQLLMTFGEDKTVTAQDSEGNVLNVELTTDKPYYEVSVNGAKMTAEASTANDREPAVVIATATNENGDLVDKMTYNVTVDSSVKWCIECNWSPYIAETNVADIVMAALQQYRYLATSEDGKPLKLNINNDTGSTHIAIYDGNVIQVYQNLPEEGLSLPLTATVTDDEGNVLDRRLYNLIVFNNDKSIIWAPETDDEGLVYVGVGDSVPVGATDASGQIKYKVEYPPYYNYHAIKTFDDHFEAIAPTDEYYEVFLAKDSNGKYVGFYAITLAIHS